MECVNEVRLVGRLSTGPEERELPSGDTLVMSRLVVERDHDPARARRQSVDVIECTGWSPRVKRAMRGWHAHDLVEVRGALRRRFFRAAGGQTAARVEIEVSSARMIRRAATE